MYGVYDGPRDLRVERGGSSAALAEQAHPGLPLVLWQRCDGVASGLGGAFSARQGARADAGGRREVWRHVDATSVGLRSAAFSSILQGEGVLGMPLLDAAAAARLCGISERTARYRAAVASEYDGRVQQVGGRWIAEERWWRALLAEAPKPRGPGARGRRQP